MNEVIPFQRAWAMPNCETFSCEPIGGFVKKYLDNTNVSVDPFARNKRWFSYTNDINPDTLAQHHMNAAEYLEMLHKENVTADLVILDPPYSPRQISECYKGFGKVPTMKDTQSALLYKSARAGLNRLLKVGGVALSFGWNSVGMGKHYRIIEILNVCHGGAHNDTICMAEEKISHQGELF